MGKQQNDLSSSTSIICTRVVHVILTVGIATVLLTKNTILRKNLDEKQYFQPILYIFTACLSLVLYFIVACMDPGFVKRGDPDVQEIKLILEDEDEDVSLYEVKRMNTDDWNIEMNQKMNSEKTKMIGNEVGNNGRTNRCFNLEPNERCGLCGLQRPIRAKHCRECKHCVRRFDHHCPWVTNCVGERNHKWFYTFLLLVVALLIWSIYISVTGYSHAIGSSSWAMDNLILLLVDILMGILVLVVGTLLCIHTYLMLNNHTTWETMSRHRISYLKELKDSGNPFNLGICRNIFTFFCYFRPFDWTIVYSKTNNFSHLASDVKYRENSSDSDDKEFCEIVHETVNET